MAPATVPSRLPCKHAHRTPCLATPACTYTTNVERAQQLLCLRKAGLWLLLHALHPESEQAPSLVRWAGTGVNRRGERLGGPPPPVRVRALHACMRMRSLTTSWFSRLWLMSLRLRSLYTLRVVGSAPSLKPCRSQNTVGGEGGWGGCMCVCVRAWRHAYAGVGAPHACASVRVCACACVCACAHVTHAAGVVAHRSAGRACVRGWVHAHAGV